MFGHNVSIDPTERLKNFRLKSCTLSQIAFSPSGQKSLSPISRLILIIMNCDKSADNTGKV